MEEIFFVTKDISIIESLETLGKHTKKFKIKKSFLTSDNYSKNNIYIIDDSVPNVNKTLEFLKKNRGNLIFLQSNENMVQYKNQVSKVFFKPIKIFELYKELINKIEARSLITENWKLDKKKLALISANKEKINLTEKEINLLSILMKNPNKTFLKDELLKGVWKIGLNKNIKIETRVLETSISRIRKKLDIYTGTPKIIKENKGYKILF